MSKTVDMSMSEDGAEYTVRDFIGGIVMMKRTREREDERVQQYLFY